MKNFKFNPKIALIISLVLITGVGIYLYFNSGANNSRRTNQAEDRGFFSFFGERQIRPVDETTVPGVSGNTSGSNTDLDGNNLQDPNLNSGDGNGDQTTVGGNAGNLSLRPIGINTNSGGGTSGNNQDGLNSRFTGGATGGNTQLPLEQVDCTPRELEFTEEERQKLKSLEARFYQVAAEIKSEQDVETLARTRQNYYNYLSSDYGPNSKKDGTGVVELTKQCFAERKNVADKVPGFVGKPIGMRPNPYITKDMFNTLAAIPPLRSYFNSERLYLKNQISEARKQLENTKIRISDLENKIQEMYEEQSKLSDREQDTFATLIEADVKNLNRYKALDSYLNENINKLNILLQQSTNDPFSYFANNTTYIEKEPFSERETELSRKNSIYQKMQSLFFSMYGPDSDVTKIMWGGGDWTKARSNPLTEDFAKACNGQNWDMPQSEKNKLKFEVNPLRCYERYYPMQDLERILGIW